MRRSSALTGPVLRRLTRVAVTLLLAVPAAAVVSIPAGATGAPVRVAPAVTETSTINQYADQVTTLGITRFPTTFTSATLTDATTVTVYATAGNAGLLAALRALPAHGAHLVVHVVAHSFRQLDDLASRIGADGAVLRASQVDVSTVAFDAPHGKLIVTLARPAGTVTATATATMVANARVRLDARYGAAWISVASTTEALAVATSQRDDDNSPWTAGDAIDIPSTHGICTLGFTTRGNKSGDQFLLTAGHCGVGRVTDTNGVTIGSVSTQYFGGSGDNDFDTIRANGRARVWYNDSDTTGNYTVAGSVIPATNSQMTVDGDINTPQHTGLTVTNNDTHVTIDFPNVGRVTIGPVVEVATSACVSGDSGGPAYVRVGSSGTVNAVGTIESSTGNHCYVFWISKELSTANLSLVTG